MKNIKIKSIILEFNSKEKMFSKNDSKESVVNQLGQPDGDVGNGCYNAWDNIFRYAGTEFHFSDNKLHLISQRNSEDTVELHCSFQ